MLHLKDFDKFKVCGVGRNPRARVAGGFYSLLHLSGCARGPQKSRTRHWIPRPKLHETLPRFGTCRLPKKSTTRSSRIADGCGSKTCTRLAPLGTGTQKPASPQLLSFEPPYDFAVFFSPEDQPEDRDHGGHHGEPGLGEHHHGLRDPVRLPGGAAHGDVFAPPGHHLDGSLATEKKRGRRGRAREIFLGRAEKVRHWSFSICLLCFDKICSGSDKQWSCGSWSLAS